MSFIKALHFVPILRSGSRCVNKIRFNYQRRWIIAHCYSGGPVNTSVHHSDPDLGKLRNLQRHFERRLRSVYQRFEDVPDCSVFQGRHHTYVVDKCGIYKMALGEDEQDMVQVLNAEWSGDVGGVIQRVRLNPSESVLAATVKNSHSEEAKCVLVRLENHTVPQEPMFILDNVFSFEWATDDVLFYSSQEELQCRRVYGLQLTDTAAHSDLIYEEKDPEFFVEVSSSRDGRVVTINCSSKSSSEVWVIDSRSPLSPPMLVQPRRPGLLYHVEHFNTQLYILANTGPGHEYQLLRTPFSCPAMQSWKPVFTPDPGSVIKDMEMLQDYCVLTVREPQGRLELHTVPLKNPDHVTVLQLPRWACAVETERLGLFDTKTFSFLLSSPIQPPVRYSLTPTDQHSLAQEENTHTPLPECYVTHLQAQSQDGTLVPLTLFHMQPLSALSKAPLLVHVYGAYGQDLNMSFSAEKRLLLEDRWALAYCHVRGGGECGLAWHTAGRLLLKRKSVEDLQACIETLFSSGVSQPDRAALSARSAGAVLAGALCNQHPQLLRAFLLQAPFLDVLSTMQDASLPLTVEERGEWGDPITDPQHRDNIASYCPCHNITPQLYPSMLITAYSGDRRVPLPGVLKYVERLKKAINTNTSCSKGNVPTVLLDVQHGGDHFGPEDFDQSLRESALQFAFLYTTLGLDYRGFRQKEKTRRKKQARKP